MTTPLQLGRLGTSLNREHFALGPSVERLGYGALWIAGGQLDTLERITELIDATASVPVAPAIIALDSYDADTVAELYHRLEDDAPDRFVVGLGGPQSARPLAVLHAFLDRLDQLSVPPERRIIAALGPRKLELARDRASGAITHLATVEHTQTARATLGAARTLVVDLYVILDEDPERAREAARQPLSFLSGVAGYRANLDRIGFTADEIERLDDRLVDALVAWGDIEAIAARVGEHQEAGADHAVLRVLPTKGGPDLPTALRVLAARLIGK